MADASDSFDSYSDGSSLAGAPNWTVDTGSIVVINPTGTAGLVRGNSNGAISAARYTGETFDSDQYAECVFDVGLASGGNAHGVAVRRQAGADSMYFLYLEANQPWYFGVKIAGTDTYPLSGNFNPVVNGTKIRLEVAGAGSATRLNAYYDNGSGWVALFTNYDPGAGKYLDGGSPGLAVYSDLNLIRIDSWLGGPISVVTPPSMNRRHLLIGGPPDGIVVCRCN